MKTIPELFGNSRHWARSMTRVDSRFFRNLARRQAPNRRWIGCGEAIRHPLEGSSSCGKFNLAGIAHNSGGFRPPPATTS